MINRRKKIDQKEAYLIRQEKPEDYKETRLTVAIRMTESLYLLPRRLLMYICPQMEGILSVDLAGNYMKFLNNASGSIKQLGNL